jgi:DNA-binding NarL/FixJ family response regulator
VNVVAQTAPGGWIMSAPIVTSPLDADVDVPSSDLPPQLRMRMVDSRRKLVIVSFSLERVAALSPAELAVARLAHAGLSNSGIARLRKTSAHTVARQMAGVLRKLCVGSRLALATIPEVRL